MSPERADGRRPADTVESARKWPVGRGWPSFVVVESRGHTRAAYAALLFDDAAACVIHRLTETTKIPIRTTDFRGRCCSGAFFQRALAVPFCARVNRCMTSRADGDIFRVSSRGRPSARSGLIDGSGFARAAESPRTQDAPSVHRVAQARPHGPWRRCSGECDVLRLSRPICPAMNMGFAGSTARSVAALFGRARRAEAFGTNSSNHEHGLRRLGSSERRCRSRRRRNHAAKRFDADRCRCSPPPQP